MLFSSTGERGSPLRLFIKVITQDLTPWIGFYSFVTLFQLAFTIGTKMTEQHPPLIVRQKRKLITVGWREWVALPELGITHVKAKVDSGARTSALHAFAISPFKYENKHYLRFKIHPIQRRTDAAVECVAEVEGHPLGPTDSGGHRERRYVIKTLLQIGTRTWPIEVTLTNRDPMNFRMLLGRTAMRKRILVDPAHSYLVNSAPL